MTNAIEPMRTDPELLVDVSCPHLTALLDAGGHVTLGRVEPIEGVAIAANARKVFAVLRRRPGESVAGLIGRLEEALRRATYGAKPVNEVGPEFALARPSARRRRRG